MAMPIPVTQFIRCNVIRCDDTAALQNAFFGLFSGKTAGEWGWLDYVAPPPPHAAAAG